MAMLFRQAFTRPPTFARNAGLTCVPLRTPGLRSLRPLRAGPHEHEDHQSPPPGLLDLITPAGEDVEELQSHAGGMWLNSVGAQLWPWLRRALQDTAVGALPPLLDVGRPEWLGSVELVSAEVGEVAPIVRSVEVLQPSQKFGVEGVAVEMDLEWASGAVLQLKVQPLPGRLTEALPTMLGDKVKGFTSFQVGVKDLCMNAKIRLRLCPLKAAWPVVQSVQISLLELPDLDFNLTFSSGQSTWLNLVRPWLQRRLRASATGLLLPEAYTLMLGDKLGMPPVTQEPVGVLLARVVRGENMPVRQPFQSQPHVAVKGWLRQRCQRMTSAVDLADGSPSWPEDEHPLTLLVHAPEHQQLVLEHVELNSALLGRSSATRSVGYMPLDVLSQTQGTPPVIAVQMCDVDSDPTSNGQSSSEPSREGQAVSTCSTSTASNMVKHVVSTASATVATTVAAVTETAPASAASQQPNPGQAPVLHIQPMYVPASQAEHYQLHGSGVLQMQLLSVWVPAGLPVPVHVTATLEGSDMSDAAHTSPPSPSLSAYLVDGQQEQGEQRGPQDAVTTASGRWLASTWDCVWDVIGSPGVLDTCKLHLSLSRGSGDDVISSFLEVKDVLTQDLPSWPGLRGGVYQVQPIAQAVGEDQVIWKVQLTWHPLVNTYAITDAVQVGAGTDAKAAAEWVEEAVRKAHLK